MKTISVMTPCFNEEDNVRELYERVRDAIASLGSGYRYEHIFIDNASTDDTLGLLKLIAAADHNVKIIRNTRNFGHIRSPHHALFQTRGDVVIALASDLQDPPEMIVDMVRAWEAGMPVVIGVKATSEESGLMFWVRTRYYKLVNRLSGIETYEHFTGFGLYDRKVVDIIKCFKDPYPYFRGMVAEIGLPHKEITYHQPTRKHGLTKNNLYTLYDLAMLGITNYSKVPLRLAVFGGFGGAACSMLCGLAYLVYKLLFWRNFSVGIAPLVIGMFFLGSLQLVFMGILGEYVGAIHTQVQDRPLVFEHERVNFEYQPGEAMTTSREVVGAEEREIVKRVSE
jgi:polyisoprenyl-phosphate glycosyltransferase